MTMGRELFTGAWLLTNGYNAQENCSLFFQLPLAASSSSGREGTHKPLSFHVDTQSCVDLEQVAAAAVGS